MEVYVQRREPGGELVAQAREGEGRVRQDEGSAAPHRLLAAGHAGQPLGERLGESLVQGLGRASRGGVVEPTDRAHHAGRRHAAEKAVALDQRRSRPGPGRPHRRGQSSGPAAHDDDVVAQRFAVHASPSAITSTSRPTSSSLTTPSIHDMTRLLCPAQRLKNTPSPGLRGTAGTWYAFTTRRSKHRSSSGGKSV